MRPADLGAIRTVSAPTIDPAGRSVVYAVARPDVESNRTASSLWRLAESADATPQRLTVGGTDTAPTFSPDGTHIAFLRSVDRKPPQIWLLPADGGEPRPLTAQPLGVTALSWSPDGTRIAFSARVPEPGRYGTDPEVPADEEAPRLITHRRYLADGVGYILDRPQKLFIIDVQDDDATAQQVTTGEGDDEQPTWIDGGERIAFLSRRTAGGRWRPDTLIRDVCSVRPTGKGFQRHTPGCGDAATIVADPAGAEAYVLLSDLGESGQDFVGVHHHWHRLGDDTPVAPVSNERATSVAAVTDRGLVAAFEVRGEVLPRVLGASGWRPLAIGAPGVVVSGIAGRGGLLAVAAGTAGSYGELFVGGPRSVRQRTAYADLLTGSARPVAAREHTAAGYDGHPVHGWVVAPDGPGPHPVVLMVHGGPFAQYTAALFDESQVLAGAGYAVVMCNPRGSSGYGEAHGRAIRGAIGGHDAADILAFLDDVLGDPGLDSSRVGVMGGSYGGLMTTWLLGHSDRFVAGISERAVNSWDSLMGTSDIGWYFVKEYVGASAVDQSPLTHADGITDPLLIIHSERDFRCPLEQAQRLFELLMRRGVPTELLIFPGEGHELSRTGQPRHRLQRFEHILRWWAMHLPTPQNRPT